MNPARWLFNLCVVIAAVWVAYFGYDSFRQWQHSGPAFENQMPAIQPPPSTAAGPNPAIETKPVTIGEWSSFDLEETVEIAVLPPALLLLFGGAIVWTARRGRRA